MSSFIDENLPSPLVPTIRETGKASPVVDRATDNQVPSNEGIVPVRFLFVYFVILRIRCIFVISRNGK